MPCTILLGLVGLFGSLMVVAFYTGAELVHWLTVWAEILVAFVIYYEVEEHRIDSVLSELTEEKRYCGRGTLYDSYAGLTADTIAARGEAFLAKLKTEPNLRREADLQLLLLSKAHRLVKRSCLHRRLMAEWLPHVVVGLWLILEPYVRLKEGGTISQDHWFRQLLAAALRRLSRLNRGVSIYKPDDMSPALTIPPDKIAALLAHPEAPFKENWKALGEPSNEKQSFRSRERGD